MRRITPSAIKGIAISANRGRLEVLDFLGGGVSEGVVISKVVSVLVVDVVMLAGGCVVSSVEVPVYDIEDITFTASLS